MNNGTYNSQPPAYPPPPQNSPMQAPTPSGNRNKIIIGVIVAIVAVVVILAMLFLMSSPLLGTWDMESMSALGMDIPASGAYVQFSLGGKGEMGMPNHLTGIMDITEIEWKDLGENQIRITDTDSGDSNIYDYTVEGNTLTLTQGGVTMTYVKR